MSNNQRAAPHGHKAQTMEQSPKAPLLTEVPVPKRLHAWEGASWHVMSISTPLLLRYIYRGVRSSATQ